MSEVNNPPTGVPVRRMARILPAAPLEIERLINALPPDVNKKLSLHDLKRIADAYNTGPCPNCYGGFQRPCQWCGDTEMLRDRIKGLERCRSAAVDLIDTVSPEDMHRTNGLGLEECRERMRLINSA